MTVSDIRQAKLGVRMDTTHKKPQQVDRIAMSISNTARTRLMEFENSHKMKPGARLTGGVKL